MQAALSAKPGVDPGSGAVSWAAPAMPLEDNRAALKLVSSVENITVRRWDRPFQRSMARAGRAHSYVHMGGKGRRKLPSPRFAPASKPLGELSLSVRRSSPDDSAMQIACHGAPVP